MSKALVVTGHLGFIGFNFLQHCLRELERDTETNLLKKYDHLVLIDRDSLDRANTNPKNEIQYFGVKSKLLGLDMGVWEETIDITKTKTSYLNFKDRIDDEFIQYDVLNFASESHVDDSIKDPFYIYKSNALLVPCLIDMLGYNNIKNFWHIRTDEEFGHLQTPYDPAFNINSSLNPRNPYSSSKVAQTTFLQSLKTTFNFPVGFFCLANQYGPYQHVSKMIPATVKRLVDGDSAKIYGEGEQLREWTFVGDTVREIYNIVNSLPTFWRFRDTIMIADSEGLVSNKELVFAIIEVLKDTLPREKETYENRNKDNSFHVQYVTDRKGHDFCYKLKSDVPTTGKQVTLKTQIGEVKVSENLINTIKYYAKFYNEYSSNHHNL